MISVHALLARAKLPDTHRRMRNDGKHENVSREKCTAPRASNRPSILVYGEVRRDVYSIAIGSSVITSRRERERERYAFQLVVSDIGRKL